MSGSLRWSQTHSWPLRTRHNCSHFENPNPHFTNPGFLQVHSYLHIRSHRPKHRKLAHNSMWFFLQYDYRQKYKKIQKCRLGWEGLLYFSSPLKEGHPCTPRQQYACLYRALGRTGSYPHSSDKHSLLLFIFLIQKALFTLSLGTSYILPTPHPRNCQVGWQHYRPPPSPQAQFGNSTPWVMLPPPC